MDQHAGIDPLGYGGTGCGRTDRLHDTAAEARLVHPQPAGAQSPAGSLPGAKGALLLRLCKCFDRLFLGKESILIIVISL